MSSRRLVEFVGEAAALLSDDERAKLEEEIEWVFRAMLPNDEPPQAVTVRRSFTSFTLDLARRAVFGVEVRTATRYETHILKLGRTGEVKQDCDNWQACTVKGVASRIFNPVRPVPLPDPERFAAVYTDGYTLFGPNREDDQPQSLEVVIERAVNENRPVIGSVERAVTHVYTDLGVWFFPGSRPDPAAAAEFYRRHLKTAAAASVSGKPQTSVFEL